jgi:outer membrane protein assembly factor BamB
LIGLNAAGAEDWPTYRHDAARSGVTSQKLQLPLETAWSFRSRSAPAPAWGDPKPEPVEGFLEGRRIHFDDVFQVAADAAAVYFGSSADNKVYCLDAASGQIRWTKITGGPVRLAPTLSQGRLYVGSDDGYAYCLDAADGSEVWKFRAAPEEQRVLGHGKMISLFPLRSGVLVDDGVAYLAAGIFPAEGLFLFALDAGTGSEIWRNDTLGEPSQSHISPQGYLLASKSTLYAPMARVSPASFERKDGTLKQTTYFGKAVGGTYALLADEQVFTGTGQMVGYDGVTRDRFAAFAGRKLVVRGDAAYVSTDNELVALDRRKFPAASKKVETIQGQITKLQQEMRTNPTEQQKARATELATQLKEAEAAFAATTLWRIRSACNESLILAGDVLLAGGPGQVIAVAADAGKQLWTAGIEGTAKGLAVASGRLLVSTDAGLIYCFAPQGSPQHGTVAQPVVENPYADSPLAPKLAEAADQIVRRTGITRGFCLVIGLETGQLALELAKRTELTIYAVDDDAQQVAAARGKIDAAGYYGDRVCVEQWPLDAIPYADYFANLIVSESAIAGDPPRIEPDAVLRMLKPLGGTAMGPLDSSDPGQTQGAQEWIGQSAVAGSLTLTHEEGWVRIVRGPIPGAGSWTHLYANSANNACGDDRVVKAPLGVLWFGDPEPGVMVNRHQRAAGPLSIDGRLFIQGENVVMAYDAYNGLELWRREIPGAMKVNASHDGSNLALNHDGFFVAVGGQCLRLDPATGKTVATYPLPPAEENKNRRWGYTACSDELLYGSRISGGLVSDQVFAVDLNSGKHRWVYEGKRISNNAIAIGDGTLFLVDANVTPEERDEAIDRQRAWIAQLPDSQRAAAEAALSKPDVRLVVAIDAASGEVRWKEPVDLTHCGEGTLSVMYSQGAIVIFGVYLDGHLWTEFFAGQFDARRVTVMSAEDGEFLWSKPVGYRVRPLIIGDTLHTEPWAYNLHTGEPVTRTNPITGATERWQFARSGHHCGLPVASPNCLFFRSYNLGYYDLNRDDGTMHFAGQRPGCWINFIPAGGLLLMPEASAGCMCPFPNMCSVVFKPTTTDKAYTQFSVSGPATPVQRLALNFGAPGDKSDSGGNLWLGYPRPFNGRLVLPLDVKLAYHPGGKLVQRNSNYTPIAGTPDPWLLTSAALGLKSCEIPLMKAAEGAADYVVRLAFSDPDNDRPGARVFDVKLQGKTVLEAFDVAKEAGGSDRAVVKEFAGIEVTENLLIELLPKTADSSPGKTPILQAVEIIRQRVTRLGCAMPDILINDKQPVQSINLELANIRPTPFAGTLRLTAPDGFQVAPKETKIELARGDHLTIPVRTTVARGVKAGEYRLSAKLIADDGAVELERASQIEHLGTVSRLVVPVVEDAGVHAGYPDLSKGNTANFIVDGGDQKMADDRHAMAFLKFRFDLPGKSTRVWIRLQADDNPSGDAGRVCLVTEPWSEKDVCYSSRPRPGRELGRLGRVEGNEIIERPLDLKLSGKTELSLALDPTSCDGIYFFSRESGHPAELIIEYVANE